MKIKKRNLLIMIMLILLSMILGIGIFKHSSAEAGDIAIADSLTKHAEIQQREIALIEKVGDDTPYPQIYGTAEALVQLKGYDYDEAAKEAADRYVEKKALVWYAEQNGIVVTEQEFEQHLQNLIDSIKTADNFAELKAAYEKEGLTIEDLYHGNAAYYRDIYIINQLYDKWMKEHLDGETRIPQSRVEEVDSAWEKFIANTVSKYKATSIYETVKSALINSQKVYCKSQTVNISALKKENIWLSDHK